MLSRTTTEDVVSWLCDMSKTNSTLLDSDTYSTLLLQDHPELVKHSWQKPLQARPVSLSSLRQDRNSRKFMSDSVPSAYVNYSMPRSKSHLPLYSLTKSTRVSLICIFI